MFNVGHAFLKSWRRDPGSSRLGLCAKIINSYSRYPRHTLLLADLHEAAMYGQLQCQVLLTFYQIILQLSGILICSLQYFAHC